MSAAIGDDRGGGGWIPITTEAWFVNRIAALIALQNIAGGPQPILLAIFHSSLHGNISIPMV